jgi:peroxiredoxin
MLRDALTSSRRTGPESYQLGEQLPNVGLVDLSGEAVGLQDLTAEVGVLAFLTTTCPYCRNSLPVWEEVHSELTSRGLPLIGISFDPLENTRHYADEHGIEWPVYVLASDADRDLLKVAAVPLTISITPAGVVTGVWFGELAPEDSSQIIGEVARTVATTHRAAVDRRFASAAAAATAGRSTAYVR